MAAMSDSYFPGRVGGVLGTPEQIARDEQAVRIYRSEPVQRAITELEAVMAKDVTASLPDAKKTLRAAAEATAMAQATAVGKDAGRPIIYWSPTAQHSWGKLQVPLAGLMIDDPDNIYRTVAIDGAASYEISGKVVGGKMPAQETFILHEEQSGATRGEKVRNNQSEAGMVSLHDLKLASDGSFTITVDSSPVNGRVNHLQTNPEVRSASILIRDTLADWDTQNQTKLTIRRLSGPPVAPAPSEAELAAKAAELTVSTGTYWLAWAHRVMYDRPVNTITHDLARVTGWGRVNCGHYRLAADEALVVHLERRGAAYLGFQLSDAWGQGQDYGYMVRTGSLNGSQARPNADGTYSYVIAGRDPGVWNWLDTIGSSAGTFCIRWQKMAAGENAAGAVKRIGVVKIDQLKAALPTETQWVTPAKRTKQLKERKASYMRRLEI